MGIGMYLTQMFFFALIFSPVIVIWRLLARKRLKKKSLKTNIFHETGLILFAAFSIGLAALTVFPKLEFTESGVNIMGNALDPNRMNFIPFMLFKRMAMVKDDQQLQQMIVIFLGNILMFMPIGFFSALLWKKIKTLKILLTGTLTTLFIEIVQMFVGRETDIDDVIFNILGVYLGYLIYLLLNKLFGSFFDKFKVTAVKTGEND